jgi:hypothetical protein
MTASNKLLLLGGALLVAGCTWTDFDKLEDEAPVVSIDAADSVRVAFGRSLVTDPRPGHPMLLVGGQPGTSAAVAYDVGTAQNPGVDPTEDGFCSNDRVQPCQLADQPATARLVNAHKELDTCFVYGWGLAPKARQTGVVARCSDGSDVPLPAPAEARKAHDKDFERDGQHQPQFMASDHFDKNTVVVGLPEQEVAWFYPAGSLSPLELELPGDASAPKSYGGQVALASLDGKGDERLIAVAAPSMGQVYLYKSVGRELPVPVGCLGDGFGFGRTLTTGHVDDDGVEDLVVADEQLVTAFSGAVLGALPQAVISACRLSALPAGAVLASFGCGTDEAASGCNGSDFGAALTVADLDGDDDGEIIVGAPSLEVYGVREAGALLVYDAEGSEPHALSDVLFASDPETDDHLGFSLETVPQKGVEIVAAGAPGRSQVDLFFCSELLPKKARTGRCAP